MPSIPPAMNVGVVPIMIPSIMKKEPVEGRASVPYTLNWAKAIARSLTCFSINLQDGGTANFSQICGLIIDNSNCGSDLDFIFPDTDVVISIPAYAPYTCLQVNTQQVQFFVRALGPIAGDVTAFSVLNYAPDPVAVPITVQQSVAAVNTIAITGAGSTQIIPAGVNGTIQGFSVNAAWNTAAGAFNDLLTLQDGAGTSKQIWFGNVAGPTGAQQFSGPLTDMPQCSIRFQNGLVLQQSGGFVVGGTLDVNVYYITP